MEGGDTLNPIALILTQASSGTAAATQHADGAGGTLFKAQLGDSVAKLFAGKRSADVPATPAASSTPGTLLEHAIKDQLDKGVPLSDVIAKLASSLAASVAAQLGISPQAALQQLTQVFSQALQANDTGPPKSNAERASSLVSRLRQIAEVATGVTNGDSGQSIRLIAGQRLDAEQAKASPAPDPDSILRDALAALAAPASPSVTGVSALASGVPAAPAPVDAPTVPLTDPAQAIATGGDTPLGRMLARATGAAGHPPAPISGPIQAVNPDATTSLDPAAKAATSTDAAALDGFVQAFVSALARSDAPATTTDSSTSAPAAAAAPVAAASPSQPILSIAIPIVHDAVPIAPPAPAATLPQTPYVDANDVIDQIVRGMAIRTTDGQSEVRMRLDPAALGDVSVRLIVSGGTVDASLTAHTAEAQNALAGGQTQLAKTLADAGLKLQSFTVGLAGGGFADTRDQSRSHDSWNRPTIRRIGGVQSVESAESDASPLDAIPSFGPPIYTARSLPGALSYLV